MKRMLLGLLGVGVLLSFAGCGVGKATLDDADRRIQVLKTKGVPDTSLSQAVVELYGARAAMQRNDYGVASTSAKKMRVLVAQAEAAYEEKSRNLKPYLDSLRAITDEARKELSGIHLRTLDSLVAKADSFTTINWALQAQDFMRKAADAVPVLAVLEKKSQELRPQLPGRWTAVQVEKSEAHPEVNMPRYRTFDLYPNGKASFTEKAKGRAGTHLKLDYEFISSGTWDMVGDTIFVFVDRFKRVREESEERRDEGGREKWEKKSIAPMDSAITDGSQDRFVAWYDLQGDFKREKKY